MEPTDSRLQASEPQNDGESVVFDMVPLEESAVLTEPSPSGAPSGLPLDVVPVVDPSAGLPLTSPAVHPSVGPVSQLEAALGNAAAQAVQASPAVVPADPAAAPTPATAPAALPVRPLAPSSPITPFASIPIAVPTIDPLPEPMARVAPTTAQPAQPQIRVNLPADAGLSLPVQPRPAGERGTTSVSAAPVGTELPTRLPMLPLRMLAVGGTAGAMLLFAWQSARVMSAQDRLASLSMLAMLVAAIAAASVVMWTWVVTENARRLVDPARTQELPDPSYAAMTWLVPLAFIAGAAAAVTYLSDRFNTPSEGTESSLPLMLALGAIVLALPLMYSPVTYMSGVVRKIGGRGIRFAEWISVPVVLSAVGVAMIAGLRVGGAFGDDVEGLAPAWVIGVAAILPAVVVVALGWSAAAAVEADVERAFDRRLGVPTAVSKRRSRSLSLTAGGGPNHKALRQHGYINQLPGTHVLGVAITAVLAGLSLLSLIGAVVVFLFWQETQDGVLLPAQSDRAWDVVSLLHTFERNVALGLLALAMIWSFLAITNIRLASMRRRNPIFAAVAWTIAAVGVSITGAGLVADGSVGEVILGFAIQAFFLAIPVFLLYRGAGSIGARRQLLRILWAIGVVLLVQVQGLGDLWTADASVESTQVARLAGYLAIGAMLQLLAMFAAAGAMRALSDATTHVAMRHNSLVAEGRQTEASRSAMSSAPQIG